MTISEPATSGEPATLPQGRRAGRPRSQQVADAAIEAAIDELDEKGYQGLRMEAVAARAAIAKTTLYRRWPGKDELVLDALGALKGPVAQAPGGTVRDDLVYLLDWMRRSWMDSRHGDVMRRLIAEAAAHPHVYDTYRRRLINPRRQVMLEVLRRAVDEGVVHADADLDQVVDLLVSPTLVAGLTQPGKSTRADAEFVVDTVLAGLAP